MAYLLDTNVFIQAKNLHYSFDFCPAFWEWLIAQNSEQRVFSIEQLAGEIAAGADDFRAGLRNAARRSSLLRTRRYCLLWLV